MPRIAKRIAAALLAAMMAAPAGWPAPTEPPQRPKLVVILVVDQMRSDYITTYGRQWSKGLRRLIDQGAWFTDAVYPYLNTVTCAGHATVSTGTLPYKHGMILNSWWNRATGKSESCTGDPGTPLVSFGAAVQGGESASHLQVPTFSQRLREQLGKEHARVVSFSRKARSAIMLAGPDADLVAWIADGGTVTTSQAYTAFPFLRTFVHFNPVKKDLEKTWRLSLARSKYLFKDSAPGEKPQPPQWTTQFPHRLRNSEFRTDSSFYDAWTDSPFADEYLGQLARTAASALNLGRGDGTDLLAIGFSALDGIGHDFGPRSFEVQDTLVRLDRTIGELLDYLDRRVGKGNYVVALTADHGVADLPEQLQRESQDAGRVPTGRIVEAVMKVLDARWGAGRFVQTELYTDFYFSPGVYERLLANPEILEEVIAAIRGVPGVGQVFRGDLLSGLRESGDRVERAAALSYFPKRSGDLIIVPKANWFFVTGRESSGSGTTHGTAHPYDARVPLVLFGAGVRPGRYSQAASPADIAPTLAALAGIHLPDADGHVLSEALVPQEKIQHAEPDSLLDSPR